MDELTLRHALDRNRAEASGSEQGRQLTPAAVRVYRTSPLDRCNRDATTMANTS